MALHDLAAAPSIVPDADGHPAFARAMSTELTAELIRSGRTAAVLMLAGWPRITIEACINEAEAIALSAVPEVQS